MAIRELPSLRPLALAMMTVCGVVAASIPSQASAANAVFAQEFDGGATALTTIGETLVASGASATSSSYTDNAFLKNSAWAHTGSWWNFELKTVSSVKISVVADSAADFAPGFTVWASGATIFDGGSSNPTELSDVSINAPHSFNATGDIGDRGTLWMSGSNGNMKETLGYAIAGPRSYGTEQTGWDELMIAGAHDVSISNTYESGVSGSVDTGFAELLFNALQPGFYTIFVGGTDGTLGGSPFTLSVSAVPLPPAVLLFGTGLAALAARRRRRES